MNNKKINWSEYYESGGAVDMSIPKNIRQKIYDKDGNRRIDDDAINALTEYIDTLPQTAYTHIVNGRFTAERIKLHQRIINTFKKDLVCINSKQPIAILMGGSPASGKSTFLKKYAPYLLKSEILKVDADEVRSMLPEYKGWNASQTHIETRYIVDTLLSNRTIGIPCKYDIIYDGTMNSVRAYLPLIKLLKELKYKIFIVYIDKVPKEVVIERALKRYKSTGRFVPMAVIDDFYSNGKASLDILKGEADGYMIIDGSDGEYRMEESVGMALPKSRLYSKIGTHITKLEKKERGGLVKDETPNYLKMFLGK